MKNHYDILGIQRNATPEQIKTAYRKLSVKFHPDKNNGETFFSDMFRQINEAYTTLYDVNSRRTYDSQLYKFEYPEPVVQKVYQQAPRSPKTYNSTKYYSAPIDKWASVKKWNERRNIMLIINGILILIIFLFPKKGNSGVSLPSIDSSANQNKSVVHHHRHKHQSKKHKDTLINNNLETVAKTPVYIEHIPTPEKIIDSSTVTVPKSTLSNDTIVNKPQKKKAGFLNRLFGKKNKDTAQVKN